MQNQSPQKYNFWSDYSYGTKLITGVTRDQVIKELSRYPLLMKYYKKNETEIQTRIIDTLMREPSGSDCPGFIYGFKELKEHNKNPYSEKYEIKMGRTKRQVPQNRIYEWQKDDGHEYVELFTIRSEFNNKLQALVHLFYAYARKLRIINGKRRIEWFNFQEKALNAAVTALINELMEKVHHLGKINQGQKPTLLYDLADFCNKITEEISSIQFLKKRLFIVGLKQSGKSVLKAMLNGQDLKARQSTGQNGLFESQNSFEIQLPNSIDFVQNIIELSQRTSHIHQLQNLIQRFKDSFILWSSVNSIEEIGIPCLIVTQNDLLSSQMVGFRKALHNLLKYIKITPQLEDKSKKVNQQHILEKLSKFKLFLVVSKIENNRVFTEQKLKKYFASNKNMFLPQEYTILQNSSIFFIPHAQSEGKFDYNVEKIIRQIHNQDFEQMKLTTFEYFDPTLTKICEETIHYSYEEVGQKFKTQFKQSLKKITQDFEAQKLLSQLQLNEGNEQNEEQSGVNSLELIIIKLKFILSIENLLNGIKTSAKQQQILKNLKRLHLLLSIEGSDNTISQLLVFCECMLKLSIEIDTDHSEGEDFDKKQDFSKVFSPLYLSNSLLFSSLEEKISQQKQQMREEVNSIIENELKIGFEKVITKFYPSLQESSQQSNKVIFNKVYDILFRMMNVDSAIESERVEKKLSLQLVSNEVLEEQILIGCVDELMGLLGGKGSVYFEKLRAIMRLISLTYNITRNYKIRTINVVSRIREAIFVATKGKKQVQMVSTNTDTNENKSQQKKQFSNNKKTYNNKSNHIQIDSQTKMILNKKNEVKNERLLNYINAKKKYIEQGNEMQSNQSEVTINSTNNNNNITINRNTITQKEVQIRSFNNNVQEKKQLTTIIREKQTTTIIDIQSEDSTLLYPSLNHELMKIKNAEMSSQQEFFSMPQSDEDKKELQKAQIQMKKLHINQKSSESIPAIDQNQFATFVHQLVNSFQTVKHKYSSINSLKSLNQDVLFKILVQQNFNQYTFNYSQSAFVFDLPSITLHNSYVIIFAKKIQVNKICEINFKVHYKNRKPNKINFILISEGYDGAENLKIQDNKYGKVLMIQITKKSEKKYKIHQGYYTKNKRNEKKLQDLKINDLVESYCKIIN